MVDTMLQTSPQQSPLDMDGVMYVDSAADGTLNSPTAYTYPSPTTCQLTSQHPYPCLLRASPQSTAGASSDSGYHSNASKKRRGSDLDISTPVTKQAEATLDVSKAHFLRTHHLIKPLSEGDNGETHAAILKADLEAITAHYRNNLDSAAFFQAVRSRLRVVKFAKAEFEENDLLPEISFFAEKFHGRHHTLNTGVGWHYDGPCQWLVLPFMPQGSLASFIESHPQDLSLAMRWHIVGQIAEALLFLFFGVADVAAAPAQAPQPRLVVHGDIFAGNTLLGPPLAGDPTGFPRVVVADFGRADATAGLSSCGRPGCTRCPHDELFVWRHTQLNDIHTLGDIGREWAFQYQEATLQCAHSLWVEAGAADDKYKDADGWCERCLERKELHQRPTDPAEATFKHCCDKLMDFKLDPSRDDMFQHAYYLLRATALLARHQKVVHHTPLSPEACQRLNTPFVSDKDVRGVLSIQHRRILEPKSKKALFLVGL